LVPLCLSINPRYLRHRPSMYTVLFFSIFSVLLSTTFSWTFGFHSASRTDRLHVSIEHIVVCVTAPASIISCRKSLDVLEGSLHHDVVFGRRLRGAVRPACGISILVDGLLSRSVRRQKKGRVETGGSIHQCSMRPSFFIHTASMLRLLSTLVPRSSSIP